MHNTSPESLDEALVTPSLEEAPKPAQTAGSTRSKIRTGLLLTLGATATTGEMGCGDSNPKPWQSPPQVVYVAKNPGDCKRPPTQAEILAEREAHAAKKAELAEREKWINYEKRRRLEPTEPVVIVIPTPMPFTLPSKTEPTRPLEPFPANPEYLWLINEPIDGIIIKLSDPYPGGQISVKFGSDGFARCEKYEDEKRLRDAGIAFLQSRGAIAGTEPGSVERVPGSVEIRFYKKPIRISYSTHSTKTKDWSPDEVISVTE